MFLRLLISLLLIASLATATLGRPVVKLEENQAKEGTLTPDEEREARELAEDFIKRLEESEDVTPLLREFYVSDFAERLRDRMEEVFPLAAKPEVAALMSSEEILRAYAASINCIYLASVHYTEILRRRASERAERGEPKDSDAENDLTIEELIPPKLIKLIQSDPALAAMLAEELNKENEKRASQQETSVTEHSPLPESERYQDPQESASLEDIIPFKSIEQMRHYTSLAEQGVALLREHINSFPKEQRPSVRESWYKLINRSTNEGADENKYIINPRLNTLTDEYMGYSAGTRLIRADVLMFHIDMVRATDGRLKVLNVYMMMD